VVEYKNFRSFVVADIPGIIEGAHEGAGLGPRFLRHVERTRILLHILDPCRTHDSDPIKDYETLNSELAQFDEDLAGRPQIVVVNKIDLPDVRELLTVMLPYVNERNIPVFSISAATGEGIPELLDEVARYLWNEPSDLP
jgi:GTP-binding protein